MQDLAALVLDRVHVLLRREERFCNSLGVRAVGHCVNPVFVRRMCEEMHLHCRLLAGTEICSKRKSLHGKS